MSMRDLWRRAIHHRSSVIGGLLGVLMAGCSATPDAPAFDGANLYLGYCAACHGASGAGDAPMAAELTMRMPDLRTLARRHDGEYPADLVSSIIDGRSYRAVHGSADMPVWGYQFRREEGTTDAAAARVAARIEALVRHVDTLQR
jgi:mono/diheme cytochrome c family protein